MERLTVLSIRLSAAGAAAVAIGSIVLLALDDVAKAVIGFSGASILGYGAYQAHRYSRRYALQAPRYHQPLADIEPEAKTRTPENTD